MMEKAFKIKTKLAHSNVAKNKSGNSKSTSSPFPLVLNSQLFQDTITFRRQFLQHLILNVCRINKLDKVIISVAVAKISQIITIRFKKNFSLFNLPVTHSI